MIRKDKRNSGCHCWGFAVSWEVRCVSLQVTTETLSCYSRNKNPPEKCTKSNPTLPTQDSHRFYNLWSNNNSNNNNDNNSTTTDNNSSHLYCAMSHWLGCNEHWPLTSSTHPCVRGEGSWRREFTVRRPMRLAADESDKKLWHSSQFVVYSCLNR